jgi:hypothetical protein
VAGNGGKAKGGGNEGCSGGRIAVGKGGGGPVVSDDDSKPESDDSRFWKRY